MSIDRTRPEHKPAPHADPGPGVNGAPHNPTGRRTIRATEWFEKYGEQLRHDHSTMTGDEFRAKYWPPERGVPVACLYDLAARSYGAEPGTVTTKEQYDALCAKVKTEERAKLMNGHAGRLHPKGDELARRVRAYLKACPPAVSGQRGHDTAWGAALRAVRGFDLSPEEAYPLFDEWNAKCVPPWSDGELWHKLRQAYTVGRRPPGYLLDRRPVNGTASGTASQNAPLRNYVWDEVQDGDTVRRVCKGRSLPEIAEELEVRTGGWPKRVGGVLFVEEEPGKIRWLTSASELFAWIGRALADGSNPGVDWSSRAGPPKQEFFDDLRANTEEYEAVSTYPHEPPIPGVYYSHPAPTGGDGKALQRLLGLFGPATAEDEDLLWALCLTLFWGGPPGARPAWLLTAPPSDTLAGRGIGKSVLAQFVGSLVGGHVETRQDEKFSDFVTRLLSPLAATKRVVLLDNLKSLKYSNAILEALVTATVISGKQLYAGEGQRPNHLVTIITANGASLSDDLSQRSIPVHLARMTYKLDWQTRVKEYIDEHRWAIVGDCLAELRREGRPVDDVGRFGLWQGAVLSKCPEPDSLKQLIERRQLDLNEDQAEGEHVREGVVKLLVRWAPLHKDIRSDPEANAVWLSSAVMAEVVREALQEKLSAPRAARYLASLKVRGLVRHDRNYSRGWGWYGDAVTDRDPPGELPDVSDMADR